MIINLLSFHTKLNLSAYYIPHPRFGFGSLKARYKFMNLLTYIIIAVIIIEVTTISRARMFLLRKV